MKSSQNIASKQKFEFLHVVAIFWIIIYLRYRILCSQVPAIKKCSAPVFSALQVCVTEQSGQDLKIFQSAIDEALDFICFKGGERIASNNQNLPQKNQ